MTQFTDFLKPEALFSSENIFALAAKQAHELSFEALDKTARLQLDFARDLLEINRKRFESMYAGGSFADTLSAHQEFALETGKRGLSMVDDAQAIASELQEAAKESANEFVAAAKGFGKPAKTASKKAKAA